MRELLSYIVFGALAVALWSCGTDGADEAPRPPASTPILTRTSESPKPTTTPEPMTGYLWEKDYPYRKVLVIDYDVCCTPDNVGEEIDMIARNEACLVEAGTKARRDPERWSWSSRGLEVLEGPCAGYRGWVRSWYWQWDPPPWMSELSPPAATASPRSAARSIATPTRDSKQLFATVTARGLNVRSGPGVEYQRLGAVGQGTEVALDGRDRTSNWVHGRVVGEDLEGWFSAGYLSVVGDVVTLSVTEPDAIRKPETTTLPTVVVQPTKAPNASAQWQEVARWAGNSIKNTETFHISSHEWRISWSTIPGDHGPVNFQIFVYRSDGGLAGVAANVIGEGSDTSFMRGAGDYYLTINTGQPYEVAVEVRATSDTSPAPTNMPVDTATWQEIARWSGNSIKNTETFNIPSNNWRIRWSTRPGEHGALNFQIFIYKADGALAGAAANVIGEGSDTSFMRGKGEYYLTINTGQPYEIIVEAKY